MSETKPETEVWYKAGLVERCVLGKYIWRDGYSLQPNGRTQPWQTKVEAQAVAKAAGKCAVFVSDCFGQLDTEPAQEGGEQ